MRRQRGRQGLQGPGRRDEARWGGWGSNHDRRTDGSVHEPVYASLGR